VILIGLFQPFSALIIAKCEPAFLPAAVSFGGNDAYGRQRELGIPDRVKFSWVFV
jgi:hypothetical protein